MTRLIEQLRGATRRHRACRRVQLDELVRAAVGPLRRPRAGGRVLNVQDRGAACSADPERLTAIIEHVIRNAQDATRAAGADRASSCAPIGAQRAARRSPIPAAAWTREFVRERLFRPFDSTKGSKGMGIGAYQVREYVRMLGGEVEVQSSPGTRHALFDYAAADRTAGDTRRRGRRPLERATP